MFTVCSDMNDPKNQVNVTKWRWTRATRECDQGVPDNAGRPQAIGLLRDIVIVLGVFIVDRVIRAAKVLVFIMIAGTLLVAAAWIRQEWLM